MPINRHLMHMSSIIAQQESGGMDMMDTRMSLSTSSMAGSDSMKSSPCLTVTSCAWLSEEDKQCFWPEESSSPLMSIPESGMLTEQEVLDFMRHSDDDLPPYDIFMHWDNSQ